MNLSNEDIERGGPRERRSQEPAGVTAASRVPALGTTGCYSRALRDTTRHGSAGGLGDVPPVRRRSRGGTGVPQQPIGRPRRGPHLDAAALRLQRGSETGPSRLRSGAIRTGALSATGAASESDRAEGAGTRKDGGLRWDTGAWRRRDSGAWQRSDTDGGARLRPGRVPTATPRRSINRNAPFHGLKHRQR